MRKWGAALAALFVALPGPAPAQGPEAPCRPAEARAIVRGFVEAFNRGDVDYLDRMWAEEPDFFWFFDSADPLRRSELSEDRITLPHYFRARALLGDQLHLRSLSVRWQRGWHAAWGVAFELHRVSEQPDVSGRYHGKGALTCGDEGQLLHAWAMGRSA
ncbi:MAG TPA: hypothetical protein VHK89_08475 [Actinomycetota bacterium]|nr:hypothetical protein [Actinomycetota bacterium]